MAYQLPRWICVLGAFVTGAALVIGCSESPRASRSSANSKQQAAKQTPIKQGDTSTALDNASADDEKSAVSALPPASLPVSPFSEVKTEATAADAREAAVAETKAEQKQDAAPAAPPADAPSEQPANEQIAADKQPRADAKNADGTYGKDHVDPVKLNGPIFEKWPKPKLAIIFSGAQDGYIEPCGCAGLENQKGGMSRRHQLIKSLAAKRWPVAAFDAGGLVKRFGRQQELKFAASVEALKTMGYSGITFGGEDLRLSTDELITAVTSVDEKPSPFVATNATLFEDKLVARHRIVEAGGMRLGVLAVVGEEEQRKVNNPDVRFKRPADAIAEVLPEVRKADCDKLILLAHTTLKEATDLGEKFGEFDYVVTTGGAEEPPAQPKKIGQRTQLIELGHKGMYTVVVGLYDNAKMPERYQRVPLDARFGESAAMRQVLVSYQDQLKLLGLAGLNLIPEKGPPKHTTGQSFVGSATCGECHTKAYAVWKGTPHAHATDTLVKLAPPRHFDPECLSCHVTGWDAQGYFPFASGYLELKQKHLHGNGCENCHGPGSRHAAVEAGELDVTEKVQLALQASMRVTQEQAKKTMCVKCHDLDNSPQYDWDTYWPQVEHKGKD